MKLGPVFGSQSIYFIINCHSLVLFIWLSFGCFLLLDGLVWYVLFSANLSIYPMCSHFLFLGREYLTANCYIAIIYHIIL